MKATLSSKPYVSAHGIQWIRCSRFAVTTSVSSPASACLKGRSTAPGAIGSCSILSMPGFWPIGRQAWVMAPLPEELRLEGDRVILRDWRDEDAPALEPVCGEWDVCA